MVLGAALSGCHVKCTWDPCLEPWLDPCGLFPALTNSHAKPLLCPRPPLTFCSALLCFALLSSQGWGKRERWAVRTNKGWKQQRRSSYHPTLHLPMMNRHCLVLRRSELWPPWNPTNLKAFRGLSAATFSASMSFSVLLSLSLPPCSSQYILFTICPVIQNLTLILGYSCVRDKKIYILIKNGGGVVCSFNLQTISFISWNVALIEFHG